jgi:hypothetical protein
MPEAGDEVTGQNAARENMADLGDAMKIIIEFFAACTYGYLRECGAVRKEQVVRSKRSEKAARRRARTRRRA